MVMRVVDGGETVSLAVEGDEYERCDSIETVCECVYACVCV